MSFFISLWILWFFKDKIEKSVCSFCCFILVLNFPLQPFKSICLQASRAQNTQRDLTVYFWSICIPLKYVSFSQSTAMGLKVIQMSVWKELEWLSDSPELTHLFCLKLESKREVKQQRRQLSAVVRGFLSHILHSDTPLRWIYMLVLDGRVRLEAQCEISCFFLSYFHVICAFYFLSFNLTHLQNRY